MSLISPLSPVWYDYIAGAAAVPLDPKFCGLREVRDIQVATLRLKCGRAERKGCVYRFEMFRLGTWVTGRLGTNLDLPHIL
jgi:hypothetical protein